MATQDPTTNYGWDLPDVSGDSGAWGGLLNSILGDDSTGIDAVLKSVSDVADAAMPKAGGTFTGTVKQKHVTHTLNNLGSSSGTVTPDIRDGDYIRMTLTGTTTIAVPSNLPASGTVAIWVVEVTNNGSSLSWAAAYDWEDGTIPTQTPTGTDIYVCMTRDGGTNVYAVRAIQDVE